MDWTAGALIFRGAASFAAPFARTELNAAAGAGALKDAESLLLAGIGAAGKAGTLKSVEGAEACVPDAAHAEADEEDCGEPLEATLVGCRSAGPQPHAVRPIAGKAAASDATYLFRRHIK
jgi:hypothetical protein